MNMSEED
jgi:Ca2+-binding EF-hand superfamily protein